MAALPFKVKATFDYNSPHEDDLSFSIGQIITVTEEEDTDWYIGEYTDSSGAAQSGLFPKNFVERYEPAPPPRPVRAARPKPADPPPPVEPEPTEPSPPSPEPIAEPVVTSAPVPAPAPVPASKAAEPAPTATSNTPPAAKSPPPVAEKPSSFRDRIAAFNKTTAAPIAPFKPSALGSSGFIKKPFVAPPPSRNAYVPPPTQQAAPAKVYRREEDPEIAERQAQDIENAEKAGLIPGGDQPEEEEDQPKVSLKDRIALLQKQQMDALNKEKPKKPPKKRAEALQTETEQPQPPVFADEHPRNSSELERDLPDAPRRQPKLPKPVETFTDGNEADQSAAGETTEDPEAYPDEDESPHVPRAGTAETPAEEEDDEEGEDTEEEEVDDEAKHQQALRERMAKLSGGMGMPGMFGGMAMPGMAGPPKKKKPTEKKAESHEELASTPPAAPRIPVMPGISRAPTGDSHTDRAATHEEEEDEDDEDQTTPAITPSSSVPKGTTFLKSHPQTPVSCHQDLSPRILSYKSELEAINWILSNTFDLLSVSVEYLLNSYRPKYSS
jgi:hypothetical protein